MPKHDLPKVRRVKLLYAILGDRADYGESRAKVLPAASLYDESGLSGALKTQRTCMLAPKRALLARPRMAVMVGLVDVVLV